MSKITKREPPEWRDEAHKYVVEKFANGKTEVMLAIIRCAEVRRDHPDDYPQFVDDVAQEVALDPKTITNYVNNYVAAENEGWLDFRLRNGHLNIINSTVVPVAVRPSLAAKAADGKWSVEKLKTYIKQLRGICTAPPPFSEVAMLRERIAKYAEMLEVCLEFVPEDIAKRVSAVLEE
jgi:hypothetical protein